MMAETFDARTAMADYRTAFESGCADFLARYPDTELYAPVRYLMDLGGKRLTPATQPFQHDPNEIQQDLHQRHVKRSDLHQADPVEQITLQAKTKQNPAQHGRCQRHPEENHSRNPAAVAPALKHPNPTQHKGQDPKQGQQDHRSDKGGQRRHLRPKP